MGILKDIKASWNAMNEPKVTKASIVGNGGAARMTFMHTEGSDFVTVSIVEQDRITSLEATTADEFLDLGVVASDMRYEARSGFYRVDTKAGGHFKVSQDGSKVEIRICKGKEEAYISFTPIEFETFRPIMISFHGK